MIRFAKQVSGPGPLQLHKQPANKLWSQARTLLGFAVKQFPSCPRSPRLPSGVGKLNGLSGTWQGGNGNAAGLRVGPQQIANQKIARDENRPGTRLTTNPIKILPRAFFLVPLPRVG